MGSRVPTGFMAQPLLHRIGDQSISWRRLSESVLGGEAVAGRGGIVFAPLELHTLTS